MATQSATEDITSNYGELAKKHIGGWEEQQRQHAELLAEREAERAAALNAPPPTAEEVLEWWRADLHERRCRFVDRYVDTPGYLTGLWEMAQTNTYEAKIMLRDFGDLASVGDDTTGEGEPSLEDVEQRVRVAGAEWIVEWAELLRQHGPRAFGVAERYREVQQHHALNRIRANEIDPYSVAAAPDIEYDCEAVGIIHGELVGIVGRKSAGKTTLFTVDYACSLSTGEPFQGQTVRQQSVRVLVAEGSTVEFEERVRAWRIMHPNAPDPWLHLRATVVRARLVAPPTEYFDEDGNVIGTNRTGGPSADTVDLIRCVREDETGTVILDNLASLGVNDMAPSEMISALNALQAIQEAAGSTVLLVHHTEMHDGKPRGLTHYEDRMSTIAHVKARKGSDDRNVECYKEPRLGAPWETLKLRLTPVDGTLAAAFSPVAVSDAERIHGAVRALGDGSWSKNAILDKVPGIQRQRGLRLIDELADDPDDRLERDGNEFRLG